MEVLIMVNENGTIFTLSDKSKKEYLNAIIGKTYKILHLIEEEKTTGYSPKPFITTFLFEINAANDLFDGKLVQIIIKLKGIKEGYKEISFSDIKKQIFEIKRIVNHLLKELEG
jgi:hypothetical protein